MSPFDMTMTDYSYRERLDLLVSTANRLVVTLNELKQADQDILSTGQVMVRLELREDETRG